ncbi:MAG: hypothetical protein SGPRY_010449 [Prymnesium sp.]
MHLSPSSQAHRLVADVASADPSTQQAVFDVLPPEAKKQAALAFLHELEEEFTRADINTDGSLSFKEFQKWAKQVVDRDRMPKELKVEPTPEQLRSVAVQTMVPYMGFGLVDNSLMILSGESTYTTSQSPPLPASSRTCTCTHVHRYHCSCLIHHYRSATTTRPPSPASAHTDARGVHTCDSPSAEGVCCI